MTIRKLLIANRGEIAIRIMRTASAMGISTVAVYSDADANAPHVEAADEAIRLGPAAPAESYLAVKRILQAAQETGCDAVHPGYGFLSENAEFARQCEAQGLAFVGPPVTAIEQMGLKSVAKALMEKAGVPLVPGYHGEDQSDATLIKEAERIGFPLLIKASAGGGGKGMRIVRRKGDLADGLAGARREAASAFGDDRLLLERYVERPRHVEVQILFDQKGHGVYLFDRDCSVQRRHQKIIEEAPAPGLSEDVRKAMGEAAVRAGEAVGYVGAGTVEFLVDADQRFYFMEMNTRLQVEHPVTEMITGLDLVEWQIRVAQGDALPWNQQDLRQQGHAIEARIYAEDPDNGFLPTSGRIQYLHEPSPGDSIRLDTGLKQGLVVGADYDPMLAKLIAYGPDRETARRRLVDALAEHRVAGIKTNTGYLVRALTTEDFQSGHVTTLFVEDHADALAQSPLTRREQLIGALVAWVDDHWSRQSTADPWSSAPGWRLGVPDWQQAEIRIHGETETLFYRMTARNRLYLRADNDEAESATWHASEDGLAIRCGGRPWPLQAFFDGISCWTLFSCGEAWMAAINHPEIMHGADEDEALTAPMHGRITAVPCSQGDQVEANAPLVIMEAMKMEHTLRAPADGRIDELLCAVGDSVEAGQILVEFNPQEAGDE